MSEQPYLNYEVMVDNALRGVLRETLRQVADQGLYGRHHFYITLDMSHPGLVVPSFLHERYPQEMVIVLENRFWDLDVQDDFFAVSLSFNQQPQRLIVPYAAVISFADPSVQFGLSFRGGQAEEDDGETMGDEEVSLLLDEVSEVLESLGDSRRGGPVADDGSGDEDTLSFPLQKVRGRGETESAHSTEASSADGSDATEDSEDENNKVVTLDAFRRKDPRSPS